MPAPSCEVRQQPPEPVLDETDSAPRGVDVAETRQRRGRQPWLSGPMLGALRSSRDFRLLVLGELVSRSGSAASFVAVWSLSVYEFGVSPGVLQPARPLQHAAPGGGQHGVRPHGRPPRPASGAHRGQRHRTGRQPRPVRQPDAAAARHRQHRRGRGFGAFMPAIGSMTPRVGRRAPSAPGQRHPRADVADRLHHRPAGRRAVHRRSAAPGRRCLFDMRHVHGRHRLHRPGAAAPRSSTATSRSAAPRSPPADGSASAARRPRRAASRRFIASLRYTWSLPVARFVLVLSCGSWIGISFFIVLEPLYVDQVLDKGPAVLGLLQTAFGWARSSAPRSRPGSSGGSRRCSWRSRSPSAAPA